MMELFLRDIHDLTDHYVYEQGEQLYRSTSFNVEKRYLDKQNVTYYSTRATFGFESIQMSISVDDSYHITQFYCNCLHQRINTKRFCKHLVAFALYIYRNIFQNGFKNNAIDAEVVNDPVSLDILEKKRIYQSLVEAYSYDKAYGNLYEVENKDKAHIKVSLTPSGNKTYFLNIKVGINKYYTVQSIKDFLKLFDNQEVYQYGKSLILRHDLINFDDISSKVISYLMMISNREIDGSSLGFRISGSKVDELLKILEGEYIEIKQTSFKNKGDDYLVNSNPYHLKFIFNDETNCIEFKDLDSIRLIQGYRKFYILLENEIRPLKKIPKIMEPLLKLMLEEGKLDLTYTIEDFTKSIYPLIYRYLEVSEEFKEKYGLQTLSIKTKLDYEEFENQIVLQAEYYLNDHRVNPLDLKGTMVEGQIEEYIVKVLALGFRMVGFNKSVFSLEGEENVGQFLETDISFLNEYGEVLIEENLAKLQLTKVPQFNVNVSYNTGILRMSIEGINYSSDELEKILQNYRNKKKYVKLRGGRIVKIDDQKLMEIDQILDDLDLRMRDLEEEKEIPLYQVLKLSTLANNDSNNVNYNFDTQVKDILKHIKEYKKAPYIVPNELKGVLREYQVDAFKWLMTLASYRFGGILADDMGLGKTLEIISLIVATDEDKPSLIVCPNSLIYNWKNEFLKWYPSIEVTNITGTAELRKRLIKTIDNDKKVIYITSYDSLVRDIDEYEDKRFKFIIIDEAQYIKNFTAQRARRTKELNGEIKFALTGTPIENSLLDLWSIFDFIMPGYLKNYLHFRDDFEKNIMKEDEEKLQLLIKKITPFILRRNKRDVLKDLPEKLEHICYIEMEAEQRKIYEANLLMIRKFLLKEQDANKIQLLAYLTRLRQICVDPKLIYDIYNHESSKINKVGELIEELIPKGHRILIFTQFTSAFSLLEKKLNEKGIKYFTLSGKTPTLERLEMVDKFNKDEETKVFIISLKAGGTGLNLVGADTVIHLDPWWNVSAENQASDRAHRIGQQKTVHVYKLICEDSVEQKVLELQLLKKELSDKVIKDDDGNILDLKMDDYKFILE